MFFRLFKHYSATTLPQHLHYTFADVFADSAALKGMLPMQLFPRSTFSVHP
jgi:hypothetical protein